METGRDGVATQWHIIWRDPCSPGSATLHRCPAAQQAQSELALGTGPHLHGSADCSSPALASFRWPAVTGANSFLQRTQIAHSSGVNVSGARIQICPDDVPSWTYVDEAR